MLLAQRDGNHISTYYDVPMDCINNFFVATLSDYKNIVIIDATLRKNEFLLLSIS